MKSARNFRSRSLNRSNINSSFVPNRNGSSLKFENIQEMSRNKNHPNNSFLCCNEKKELERLKLLSNKLKIKIDILQEKVETLTDLNKQQEISISNKNSQIESIKIENQKISQNKQNSINLLKKSLKNEQFNTKRNDQ
ncbi:hypothetical protein MHBO_002949 [Bonamia ostreae]|uniref:Uncharacterized protein n=1 Tax=Bonamia ostreae TaxID=126728 RepID=A0ABV2AP05_9EUKA